MTNMFVQALREAGVSVTSPRVMILEALHAAGGPVAPAELSQRLAGRLDRSTMYRTVDLLRRLGFIEDVSSGWKTLIELSDRFDAHHHHITCNGCGEVASLDDAAIEDRLDDMARRAGFALSSHHVELRGVCGQCQNKA